MKMGMIINNLANILTITRLALLPVIIVLFYLPGSGAAWWCLALYSIGAITDFIDGWVARKFNQVTPFGTFLDPISDKVFVVTMLLMLVSVDRIDGIGVIAVVVILTREFMVSGMREFLGPKNIKLPVTKLAKWKTTIQMLATGILVVGPYVPLGTFAGQTGLIAAAVLTVMTGWNYLKAGFVHMKDEG